MWSNALAAHDLMAFVWRQSGSWSQVLLADIHATVGNLVAHQALNVPGPMVNVRSTAAMLTKCEGADSPSTRAYATHSMSRRGAAGVPHASMKAAAKGLSWLHSWTR